MRVAFLVPSFPELSETFILRQVTGLLDRGHEVAIFAWRSAVDATTHPAVDAYDLRRRVRVLEGVRPTRLARVRLPTFVRAAAALRPHHARSLGGWGAAWRTTAALAAEESFDVVHCHYGKIGLRFSFVDRLWAAPLVVSFYGHDSTAYPVAHGPRVYAPLFARASAVVSLSAHMDERLRILGCPADRLRRIPLAVDPAAFRPDDARTTDADALADDAVVRILTVARLTEKKGIAIALRALAAVAGEFPRVRYDVIGDGPLRGVLEALVAELDLHGVVRLRGVGTEEQVQAAMRDADIFLLPSVTAADGDQEGTPTAIIEAAASGLPVVATRHAGIPELVCDGETGFLVPERDVDALAVRLRDLLRSPDRRARLGAAGRRHVAATHATAVVAERLERLYEELRVSGAGSR